MLGGLVGFERETHNRPAGLRTHMLVCVGSALLMMVSLEVAGGSAGRGTADPGRIAAQVVSGIGFLGAGTIMREGLTIRGLTTAASLWVVAALGLAAGAGFYTAAAIATLVTIATLMIMGRFERWAFNRAAEHTLRLQVADRPGQLGKAASILGEHGVNIRSVDITPTEDGTVLDTLLLVTFPQGLKREELLERLASLEGIYSVQED